MANEYVLVTPYPVAQPTKEETCVTSFASREELSALLGDLTATDWLALDLETAGLYPRYHREWHTQSFGAGQYIVICGIYQPSCGAVAIDLTNSYAGCLEDLLTHLMETQQPLVGYNSYFDWLTLAGRNARVGEPAADWHKLNWIADGYWYFKTLATEGWPDQEHGLKVAQVDVLQWDSRGDKELADWLKAKGYKKCDMYAAPADILGHYCALDAFSTYHITKHLKSIADRWPAYELVTKAFHAEVRCLIQNYFAGIPIDVPAMTAYMHMQEAPIADAHKAITTHKLVKPILDRDLPKWLEGEEPEPKRFKAQRVPGEEPPKYTKAGAVSKRWELWNEKMQHIPAPEETHQWKLWRGRMDALELEIAQYGYPKKLFNPNYSEHVAALMYNDLQFPCIATKRNKVTGEEKPTAGKDAYPGWGELGFLFSQYKGARQKQAMACSWLENTDPETSKLYPLFKIPGTTTTRLAGSGGVNAQNPVKDRGFLDCIREPEPDEWLWVDSDFVALESVLMAYITQDPGYLSIYAPGAKPDDIYLYMGGFAPGIKDKFASVGYTPGCGDKAAIKSAKTQFKDLRNASKTAVLSLGYGSGKKRLHQSFVIKGIKVEGELISREMSDKIYDTYWKAFPGVKKYNEWCEACWERTGGYMISPMGLPVSACEDKVRKLGNHGIQMTGHIFCMLWLMYLEQLMDEYGREWYPVIQDFHDESLLRVRCSKDEQEQVGKEVMEIMKKAVALANKDVCLTGTEIPMSVSGAVGHRLTQFKLEE